MNASEHVGALAALLAGVVWGFLGLFVREMSSVGYTPAQMTCLRYVVVAVVLFVYISVRNRRLFRVDLRMLILLAVVGIVGNALNSTAYFSAMERVPIGLATILQYFAPFFVVAMSVPFFGERITPVKAVAVVTAFFGCVLCTGLLTSSVDLDVTGVVFGLMSAVFFGTYTLGSKKARNDGCATLTVLFYAAVFCSVSLSPFCDLPAAAGVISSSFYNLALLLGLGLGLTLLPFGLYNYSLSRIEAGKASIISFIEPPTAVAVGLVAYGEPLTVEIAVGMVLILAALVLIVRKAPGPNTSDTGA